MAIVDIERFNSLSPRSHQKVLCRCNDCGRLAEVPKKKLFVIPDGRGGRITYRKGDEPPGFIPTHYRCKDCRPSVHIGKRRSDSAKAKMSLAHQRSRRMQGQNNVNWNPDRDEAKKRLQACIRFHSFVNNVVTKVRTGKGGTSKQLSGYSWQEFKEHIELQFTEEMAWDNIAVDHIIPVKAFIDNGVTDLKIVNHLSNLRPMFRSDNVRKSCKYDQREFDAYMRCFTI